MTPDDPRHGTLAGHAQGCRDDCCDAAKLRYQKRRRCDLLAGRPRTVPALGTVRRVRALQALGHSLEAIAAAGGVSARTIHSPTFRGARVVSSTAEAVSRAYEALSMTLAAGPYAERGRRAAAAKGWAVPLCWDDEDLDDPAAQPAPRYRRARSVEYDEVVVLRLLSGDHLPANVACRREVLRRWLAQGGSEAELCRIQGWKEGRYKTRPEEAVA